MIIKEQSINDFFNSRAFTVLMAIALIALMAFDISKATNVENMSISPGILFPAVDELVQTPNLATYLNVGGIIITGVMLTLLNRLFNFIRSVTSIFVSTFLLLAISVPLTSHILTGTLLCIVAATVAVPMFASFQNRWSQRNVFASFAIISFLSMYNYAFLYLILVVALGYILIRAMNFRSFLAMIIGIITPYWIVFGLGIAKFSDLNPIPFTNIWEALDASQMHFSIILIVASVLFTIILTCLNLLQIINYKLQARAYNGFFVYLTIATVLMMAIDYRNALIYAPVLNMCFGIQVGHFYTLNSHSKRYILVFVLIAAAVASHIMHLKISGVL